MARRLAKGGAATKEAAEQKQAANTVVPQFSTVDHGHGSPRIPATPPFVLIFTPSRWMVMEGKLVPQLSKQPLERGVNRVDQDRQGRWRMASLNAQLEEEGRTRIPLSWAPDGQSYIQAVQTRPDGASEDVVAHVTVWESAYPGDRSTHPDTAAYAEWLESLVTSGKLPACPAQVVRRMAEQAETRAMEAAAAARRSGSGLAQIRADRLAAELEVLQAHLENLNKTAASGQSVTLNEKE